MMQVKKIGGKTFSIKKLSKKGGAVGKMIYIIGKEAWHFLKSIVHDRDHARNIVYLWFSIYASYENGMLFNAVLLIDIVNKIQTLS